MNLPHLPTPARVFYGGLTAFADHFAFYPSDTFASRHNTYAVALVSLSGPRESVRALQSALIMGRTLRALLPGDTLISFGFTGSEHWHVGRTYGRTFSHTRGQAHHALVVSRDVIEGRVALSRNSNDFRRALHDKLAEHLPLPTHPLWNAWWIESLTQQEYVQPLVTSRGLYAALFCTDNLARDQELLLARLREAIHNETIPVPKPSYAKEVA